MSTVVPHCKNSPWFVSDAMPKDLDWLVDELEASQEDSHLKALGKMFRCHLESGAWKITNDPFWTTPVPFRRLKDVCIIDSQANLNSEMYENKIRLLQDS